MKGSLHPLRIRRSTAVLGTLVVFLLLLSAVPQLRMPPGTGSSGGQGSAASAQANSLAGSLSPRPSYPVVRANCTNYWGPNGIIWGQTALGALDPVDPNLVGTQSPCPINYLGHDAVHASFASNANHSGDRVRLPLHLPPQSRSGIQTLFDDFFVGTVVTGNPNSAYGQSYLQVFFRPVGVAGGVNYTITISVWSLIPNATKSNPPGPAGYCPMGQANFTFAWNSTYSCELEEVNQTGDQLSTQLQGGDFVNVTFMGVPQSLAGLRIWVNDSTEAKSQNATLSKAHTGSYAFAPAWDVACPDNCGLNWTFSTVGLSEGFDLCDNGTGSNCDSFTNSTMNSSLPVTFFAPHFWNGSAYSGDYRYFAPQSDSGACSQITAYAIPCLTDMELGTYPYFTFNGSALNFGSTWPWTTYTWSGARFEFSALADSQDFVPLFLLNPTNDSRAGFVGPSTAVHVRVSAQDLGNLTEVRLVYRLPDGTQGNISMNQLSGTISNGIFGATIPTTGGDGKITYRFYAANHAGAGLLLPTARQPALSVQRGPLPLFSLWLNETYGGCGGILVNGTTWPDGTELNLTPGTYPAQAIPCYKYIWNGWSTSGGVAINPNAASTTITLSANGTLLGIWAYNRPYDRLTLMSSPSCGTIFFNGSVYGVSSPLTLTILDNLTYSLGWSGCATLAFSGWVLSDSNLLVVNGSEISVYGNGTLTSTYIPSASAIPLTFLVNPDQSGNILFRGAGYSNDSTVDVLSGTSYPLHQDPYGGWGFSNWSIFGSAAVRAGQITVLGPTTLTANEYALTLVRVVTGPMNCGSVVIAGVAYTNGQAANVTVDTVYSATAVPCANHYTIGMGVFPLLNCTLAGTGNSRTLTVYGDCTLTVSFAVGSPSYFMGIITAPIWCGSVVVAGKPYVNSNSTFLPPDVNVTLQAVSCVNYGFVQWFSTGGIVLQNKTAALTKVAATGPGSVEAVFHPLTELILYTLPRSCGTVTVDYTAHTSGDVIYAPIDSWRQISAQPCGGYHFTQWQLQAGATVSGGELYLSSASAVTAMFAPNLYAVQALVNPGTCGRILVAGQTLGNDSFLSLLAGKYSLASAPCEGFLANGYTTTGSVSVLNSVLTVAGAGSVTAQYSPIPPSISLAVPSGSYTNALVSFTASVAVPLAPTGYKYQWTFGDGTKLVTPVNFTSHSYAAPGSYPVGVTVTDPYDRNASDNTTILVSTPPATQVKVPTTAFIGLGVAAAIVAAAVLIALRRRRAAAGVESAELAPKAQEGPRLPPESPAAFAPPEENENLYADEMER